MKNINYAKELADKERKVRVIYIGSYIPRECGIATFTKDLTTSINMLNPHCLAEIVAVNPPNLTYDYPWEVKYRFNQEHPTTYKNATSYINQSSAEVVCLQHEFGLYGGKSGEKIIPFLKTINKPIVATFHTILPNPNDHYKKILSEISSLCEAVVVMINSAAECLVRDYGVDANKIVVIPHGVPDIAFSKEPKNRQKMGLENKTIIATFGLLSSGKGIENVIEAMPAIVKKIPNATYLLLGQTHPVVKRLEGEKYRHQLEEMVKALGMSNHVSYINRYLSLDELIAYLQTIDIYITPYLNPNQITSGTLAYAVGAGLACISTPYVYAQEVLDGNRGVLVDYANNKEIAKAVIDLCEHPRKKLSLRKQAYEYGRQMTWDNVALKYLDLFTSVIK